MMIAQEEVKEFLRQNAPSLWDLLNNRAKRILPKGLADYIGSGNPSNIENGRSNLIPLFVFRLLNARRCFKVIIPFYELGGLLENN